MGTTLVDANHLSRGLVSVLRDDGADLNLVHYGLFPFD